jgi:hypothetical protein
MKKLAVLAALLLVSACRSAFKPEPVTRLHDPPAALVDATVSKDTEIRRGPARLSAAVGPVASGTALQVSNEVVNGFRRVKLPSGESGYVEAGALALGEQAAEAGAGPAATSAH